MFLASVNVSNGHNLKFYINCVQHRVLVLDKFKYKKEQANINQKDIKSQMQCNTNIFLSYIPLYMSVITLKIEALTAICSCAKIG